MRTVRGRGGAVTLAQQDLEWSQQLVWSGGEGGGVGHGRVWVGVVLKTESWTIFSTVAGHCSRWFPFTPAGFPSAAA